MKLEGLRFQQDKGHTGEPTSEEPNKIDTARKLGHVVESSKELPIEAVQKILKDDPDLMGAFLNGAQQAQREEMDKEEHKGKTP